MSLRQIDVKPGMPHDISKQQAMSPKINGEISMSVLQAASTETAEPLPPPDDEEDLVVIRSPDPQPPPSGSPTLQAASHA
jgi:hypothetical protein